ncbi:MAG: WapI family immunity protein [Arenicella sp.]
MKFFELNKRFELSVLGYQFENAEEYYDSNWLTISIKASDGNYDWEVHDSCLLTFELKEFRDWLDANKVGRFDFIENEISFSVDSSDELLNVILDFNFHPKGEKYSYEKDSEYILSFSFSKKQRADFIKFFDKILSSYPIRNS